MTSKKKKRNHTTTVQKTKQTRRVFVAAEAGAVSRGGVFELEREDEVAAAGLSVHVGGAGLPVARRAGDARAELFHGVHGAGHQALDIDTCEVETMKNETKKDDKNNKEKRIVAVGGRKNPNRNIGTSISKYK